MLQSLIIYLMSTKEKEKVSCRMQGQNYSQLGLQDPEQIIIYVVYQT